MKFHHPSYETIVRKIIQRKYLHFNSIKSRFAHEAKKKYRFPSSWPGRLLKRLKKMREEGKLEQFKMSFRLAVDNKKETEKKEREEKKEIAAPQTPPQFFGEPQTPPPSSRKDFDEDFFQLQQEHAESTMEEEIKTLRNNLHQYISYFNELRDFMADFMNVNQNDRVLIEKIKSIVKAAKNLVDSPLPIEEMTKVVDSFNAYKKETLNQRLLLVRRIASSVDKVAVLEEKTDFLRNAIALKTFHQVDQLTRAIQEAISKTFQLQ